MSDSISTPTPATPGPSDTGAVSPAPNSQPPISISDAARLLNARRREAAGEPATPASDGGRKPSPSEVAAAAAKAAAPTEQAATPPSRPALKAAADGMSAMEKALGLPGAPPPPTAPDVAGDGAISLGEGIEIEGQRLKTLDDVREFARRKQVDYSQKTRELATQRQALQQQQEALATVLPYIQPELARLQATVQNAPARPDPSLINTDPAQYLRERAVYESAMEEQNRLAGLTTLQQQAQARAMEQAVAAANETLAKEFPFWANPEERAAAQNQIVEWATTKGGFSKDELRGLTSPHHLKAMMKAALFDRWLESAKTSAPVSTSPVRGQAPPPALSERIQGATEAFQNKPDFRTGAALLAARRGTNGRAR